MVKNSDAEWKKKLTPEQFWVCRQKGTELPWSGEYLDLKTKGIYKCVCCGSELFSSASKFDSRTGWPSFHSALEMSSNSNLSPELSVVEKRDNSYGMMRVEVLCRQVIYFSKKHLFYLLCKNLVFLKHTENNTGIYYSSIPKQHSSEGILMLLFQFSCTMTNYSCLPMPS